MILRLALSAAVFAATINVGLAADPQTQWRDWALGLGKSGYRVSQGASTVIDSAACRKIVAEIPVDGTAIDPQYARFFTTKGPKGAASNMLYRLTDAEAAVMIVTLPPQAAYWGFQSYVFTRNALSYPRESDVRHTVSPDPSRYELLASLGNAVNNRVMIGRLGAVWGQGTVVYITTSNRQLADSLIQDARSHGLDANRIFVEPVGANVMTGATAAADDMISLIRYDLPKDAKAGQDWRKNIKNNVMAFRVAASLDTPVARYPTPGYAAKTSSTEDQYTAPLDELATLLHDWLETKEGSPILASDMNASVRFDETGALTGLVGALCIEKGQNCLVDTQDADSSRLGFIGKVNDAQTVFVAGVNHAATGNADDLSLTAYSMTDYTGVVGASQSNPASVGFDNGALTGSAERTLTELGLYDQASEPLRKDLPLLYVARLSRDCPKTATFCLGLNAMVGAHFHDFLAVVQRAYLKPGTTAGANPDALLTPKIIFRPAIEAR